MEHRDLWFTTQLDDEEGGVQAVQTYRRSKPTQVEFGLTLFFH